MNSLFKKLEIVYYNYIQYTIEFIFKHNPFSTKFKGVCLMFHHITDEAVDAPSTCVCGVSKFKSYLLQLIQDGYKAVSIDDALEIIDSNINEKFFIVTFDDIPESVYSNAYPFLREHHIPFTVFIALQLLDNDGYVSKQQLLELSRDHLCTIGSHTQSHSMLRKTKSKSSEIVDSKRLLENFIGREVAYFAYPYGSIHAVDRASVKMTMATYKCAFSTLNTELNTCSCFNRWFIPRIYINNKTL